MPISKPVAVARGRVAGLNAAIKNGGRVDPDKLIEARRALRELRASEYIKKVVDAAPPLTDEQRTRLAELLRPARTGVA